MAKFTLADGSEVEAFTAEELAAKLEEQTSGLKAKVDELLGESKTAKQRARELEELKAKQEEDSLKQREEFKTLYEREQEARAKLAKEHDEFSQRIKQKELESAASTMATELTRDTKRAELLRKEILQFARYSEDGAKFEMGGVEVDRDKVMAHITEQYPFLVDGSGATGGGATGGAGGGAVKKFEEYTGAELAAIRKKDPAQYDRLHQAYKSR